MKLMLVCSNIDMGYQDIVVFPHRRRSLCVAFALVGVLVSVFGVGSLWLLWLMCWFVIVLNVAWQCSISKSM